MYHTPHVPLTHNFFSLCTFIKRGICSYLCTALLRDIHHVYLRGSSRIENSRAGSDIFHKVFPQMFTLVGLTFLVFLSRCRSLRLLLVILTCALTSCGRQNRWSKVWVPRFAISVPFSVSTQNSCWVLARMAQLGCQQFVG